MIPSDLEIRGKSKIQTKSIGLRALDKRLFPADFRRILVWL